ncbi:MAG: creatininase family protein [Paenibacillaceae bacterium]|nr:creatininase family protein [Paenibacillaceae bacterium]
MAKSPLPSFYYEKLTWEEMNTAIAEERVVIIPVGSTEQHGRHLPMDVDTLLPRSIVVGAAERVPDDVLVMPTIPYGFNTHHMDYPGQITIMASAFINYCLCVTKSLSYHGFNKIMFVNGHGSNMPVLDLVSRQTVLESKGKTLCMCFLHPSLIADVVAQHRESGRGGIAHACELETSLYLYLDEEGVRKDKIEDENSLPPSDFHFFDLQYGSPVTMTPWFSTYTKSGVCGQATLATKEKGKIFYEATVERLVQLIREYKAREIAPRHDNHARKPEQDLDNLLHF